MERAATSTSTFLIANTQSGVELGYYEAKDEEHALELMAQDAGYETYAEACEVAPGDSLNVRRA